MFLKIHRNGIFQKMRAPPYMKKKPKNGGDAMYKSIANAVSDGCAVFPELYNMTKQRFDVYINQLIAVIQKI